MAETVEIEGVGDCYTAALETLVRLGPEAKVVHGRVHGRGPAAGLTFGHAWVELDGFVYDFSNDQGIIVPRLFYYQLGKITQTTEYDVVAATDKMLETDSAGPWDMSYWEVEKV